jgi:hypothetical protein
MTQALSAFEQQLGLARMLGDRVLQAQAQSRADQISLLLDKTVRGGSVWFCFFVRFRTL